MTSGFGGQGHVTQESRALSSIGETPGLDQGSGEADFVRMLQTHDYQIKFMAGQIQKAQKGINEANQNPIQQIQQFVADIIVLLGGGELAKGALDFGDLQYILPALGALFGFGEGPFPLSLFAAAQKFFFGYVVPQQQFIDVINQITEGWLSVFGIDPEFIADLKALNQAVGDLFGGIGNLLPSLGELFGALGIDAGGLGPLGQVLGPIIKLFSSFDLTKFGDIIEFITDAISPFIEQLTAMINWVNGVLAVLGFGGNVVNSPLAALLRPFQNLISFLGNINFSLPDFNPIAAVIDFIEDILLPSGLLAPMTALQNIIDDVVDGANKVGSLINSLLTNAASVLGPIPQALVSGLQGALGAVANGLAGAQSFIQGVVNTVWSALRGFPVIGGALPGLPDLEKAVVDNKANQQNFTISAIVSDYRNPTWVCRYPVADVSWPEYMINKMDVFGTTDAASAGTAHTHTASLANSMTASTAGRLIGAGTARGVYITVANTGVRDTVVLYLWQATAGSLSGVTADVFREREDGSLYRIFTQDISSKIGTSSTFIELTLPELLVAQAGEQYMVRIYNGSSIGLYAVAMTEVGGSQQQGFYYPSAPLNNATEYTAAQAITAQANTANVNWAALACKNMPSTDRFFSDDANRSAIGGLWFRKSSTAALLDIYEDEFGYTGSADGSQSAFYIHPTNRDVSRVEANLYINPASTARLGVLLHCSRDMSQMVYLGVNGTSAKIYSGSHLSLTERASLAVGGSGLWTLFYDAANDKFVVLKDGLDVGLKWTGVGSAVKHGSDFRYGGQRIEMASTEPAGTIDNWSLRDWMIAVPALVIAPVMEATAAMAAPVLSLTVAAPVMTATAAMAVPTVQVPAVITAPVMEATAEMAEPLVNRLLFADDFNRANSTNIGVNWLDFTGARQISSNRLSGTGGAVWATPCSTNDQFSEVVLATTGGPLQLLVRAQSGGWPYVAGIVTPSTGAWTITTDPSSANGNHTTRASGNMGACPVGTRLRIEAQGTDYRLYKDGVFVDSWMDTGNSVHPLTSAKRYVGVNDGGVFDEWSGGDL